MITKLLIANRGEIACRVIRTARRLGIQTVAVFSEADRLAQHVGDADEALCIGPAAARDSYLRADHILEAAKQTAAQAVHPGYGFLSENAGFAEACEAAGIAFAGPTAEQIRQFGLKHTSREIAERCGVPLLPGSGLLADAEEAKSEAGRVGYPVMLKATAGGGGIGMRLCRDETDLLEGLAAVQRLGAANFKDSGVFLEKFVERARHVEVQIFGDGQGQVVALGERDCSAQRRNQKVIEETPAPGLSDATRAALAAAAVQLGKAVNYRSAGTVEFVFDADTDAFYFLEVNTRLQVEHGVTEMVFGVDLVEWMLRLASGEAMDFSSLAGKPTGHSIQARVYAEDPARDFRPGTGKLTRAVWPANARCDHWVRAGSEITPYYDPLLGKIMVHAATREQARLAMLEALNTADLCGVETNLSYLGQIVSSEAFVTGTVITATLKTLTCESQTMEVLEAGTFSTVQAWPGRLGYWAVGVPPSGPMDAYSLRLANKLLGNDEKAAGLEMTMAGATLKFHLATTVCLTGADMGATLDDVPVPQAAPIEVQAGQILKLGAIQSTGCRAYLAVAGGIDVPDYLGSQATFSLGGFGGHAGRVLRIGDMLRLGDTRAGAPCISSQKLLAPTTGAWEIGVLYGPHAAPDFFTDKDVAMIFSHAWKVHFNSSRTGVRLIGPKPEWARTDGGEAGLHPSNIHDNAYAIGAIDFTGDMPIILGPDGPSLGGFVCPACVVEAELWKVGQLKPGDTVRFKILSPNDAAALRAAQDNQLLSLTPVTPPTVQGLTPVEARAVVLTDPAHDGLPKLKIRQAGDDYLLVEYGPLVLDFELRLRAHGLMQAVRDAGLDGIIDLTPGMRSLQIHFDSRKLPRQLLIETVRQADLALPSLDQLEVPSRIVHLPLSWDDPACRLAVEKYIHGVRADAPWCPDNLEFIRRINGLDSVADVKRIVFDASYLVLGLGDVYLGAPVAVPMDPRHRLVTTKYNPARTWTAENSVGIGGAYLCVYGMEGPGGYQFVGRTIQMWNAWRETVCFQAGKPWLLEFFDQIRFYEVSAEELLQLRDDFPRGKFAPKIETAVFKVSEYRALLKEVAMEATAFKSTREAAFEAERQMWKAKGLDVTTDDGGMTVEADVIPVPEGCVAVKAPMNANVWQVSAAPGDEVGKGDTVLILEAMKMEVTVSTPVAGKVVSVHTAPGREVAPGQVIAIIQPS
ncbi:MAG: urea carboxylase [Verrucomicrobiota bacterium]